jgi:hypothetical protein
MQEIKVRVNTNTNEKLIYNNNDLFVYLLPLRRRETRGLDDGRKNRHGNIK